MLGFFDHLGEVGGHSNDSISQVPEVSTSRRAGHHLILGGCGFLGRHVAALLARGGLNVVIADRVSPPALFMAELGDRVSWLELDLSSADWEPLLAGASVVHHYAWTSVPATATDPAADLAANVQPTLALIEALRRCRSGAVPRLIFASSGGTVYGRLRSIPAREDHPLHPINSYGAGKATAELYLGVYRQLHGLDCRIARLSNPFGAGQDLSKGQGAATTFLHRALTGQPIFVWGDGEVIRDYIHVSDAAAGLVAVASAPRHEDRWIFNIGSGQGVTLNGIITELEAHLGTRVNVCREPPDQLTCR